MTNTVDTQSMLAVGSKNYRYYSIQKAEEALGLDFSKLPYTLRVLLENMLRFQDGRNISVDDVKAFDVWLQNGKNDHELAYRPARVLMQDFTGVPAVVDLAAMRDAVAKLGADAKRINPLSPVDLVIDHSVMVDKYGTNRAFKENVELEMERNFERYEFLRSGQKMFDNFRVVPPGTGICHQVNLEYLADVVWTKDVDGITVAYPDTVVGTDSHTTMINGLAVLGWGVGGIEAEVAMLGQPISMLLPEVVGFELTGSLKEGTTATDLVLQVVEMLRAKGVVGKFVEFYGEGLNHLPLADRATIANMAPEYGATCGFFPVDNETIKYMELSGRDQETMELVEAYAKEQGLWRDASSATPVFTDTLSLDLSTVEPSIAGPKRPQDRILLSQASEEFVKLLEELGHPHKIDHHDEKDPAEIAPSDSLVSDGIEENELADELKDEALVDHIDWEKTARGLRHGSIVIAAITSCTNTSNPSVMLAAGLVAKKARALGLRTKPWVKTSLAPGSQVVSEYLEKSNLQDDLDALGFNIVGFGCTTCIGNSGPLNEKLETSIKENNLVVTSVLSGNRNFEGRVSPLTKGNYLMSPPLVVAYALAGNMLIDIYKDPIGTDKNGNKVFLKDIWPTNQEVAEVVGRTVTRQMFQEKYADVFAGTKEWQAIPTTDSETYGWNDKSTYIQNPPYFEGMTMEKPDGSDIVGAKMLALLGDSITTDHISPAGSIAKDSPAAEYLRANGVDEKDFNSYGSRRGNHEVMMRGTFANIRIKNELLDGVEGGYTKYLPTGEQMSIYDAAMKYKADGTQLVVVGGKEYGTGSSRDWAAKGTNLLGVKAVIVESFERIHRSNLVGMGVLPLTFKNGMTRKTLGLNGSETFDIKGISGELTPKMDVECTITRNDGSTETVTLLCRLDTYDEVEFYRSGGILHYAIRQLAA